MSDSYLRCYYDLAFKLKYLSKSLETSDPRLAFLNQLRGNVKELHRRLSLPNPLVPQPCFATSSSAPLSSSRFNIALVPPDNWEHIAHIAAEWSSCAHEKYLTIHGGNPPVFRTNDQARSDPGRMFSDSRSICDAIAHQTGVPQKQRLSGGEKWDHVLICSDEAGTVQAMALVDSQGHKLAYIATHPDNIEHEINRELVSRFRGAGTQIIVHLAAISLRKNLPLRMTAIEKSISFYEKLQFEKDPQNLTGGEGYFHTCPMKLTVKKIRQCAAERIRPFDQLTELASSTPISPSRKFDLEAISKIEDLEFLFPPSSLNQDEKIALAVISVERFGFCSPGYFKKVYRLNDHEISFVCGEVYRRKLKRTLRVLAEIPVSEARTYSSGLHGVETLSTRYIGPIAPRKMISEECRDGSNDFELYVRSYAQLRKAGFFSSQFITDVQRRDVNCLKYALLTYEEPIERQFQVELSTMPRVLDPAIFNDVVKRCFVPILPSSGVLRTGDLAVYEDEMQTVHAGIYRETASEKMIESKWGFHKADYVFQHSVFFVPSIYGNIVRFYRLAEPCLTTSEPV
ncbi:MAG: hypothetical protein K2P51_04605 [Rhabdochlamydiaceae bacterium]|nr:hypothetical protein [Rhabdochlamydiaceae bacterium]